VEYGSWEDRELYKDAGNALEMIRSFTAMRLPLSSCLPFVILHEVLCSCYKQKMSHVNNRLQMDDLCWISGRELATFLFITTSRVALKSMHARFQMVPRIKATGT